MRLPPPSAAVLALVVLLAGCSGPPAESTATSTTSVASGASAAATPNATALDAVPQWQVGQWWSWRIASASAAAPLEAATAVVAAGPDGYEVGSAEPEKAAQLYPFHLVALGSVDKATLAWQAHGTPVQFLRFPLRDGDAFKADFWSAPAADVTLRAATVQGPKGPEPGFTATARYAGTESVFAEADWSPRLGQFVRVATRFGAEQPFATATLVGEGRNATGAKPFAATELVRWSSNLGNPAGLPPRSFTVPADAQLVLLACFLGGAPGHFQATMTLSDQQATTCQSSSPTGASLEYHAQTRTAAAGAGEVAAAPAGQAGVTVEIFAVKTA